MDTEGWEAASTSLNADLLSGKRWLDRPAFDRSRSSCDGVLTPDTFYIEAPKLDNSGSDIVSTSSLQ